MKLIEKDRKEKVMPIIWGIILIIMIFNSAFLLVEHLDYESRKEAGNARWEQVEARIKEIEELCECKK